jgi:hypothetical protein
MFSFWHKHNFEAQQWNSTCMPATSTTPNHLTLLQSSAGHFVICSFNIFNLLQKVCRLFSH